MYTANKAKRPRTRVRDEEDAMREKKQIVQAFDITSQTQNSFEHHQVEKQ